jgi:hypothetical protein
MFNVNTQDAINKPTITGTIPVTDWLSKIKNGDCRDKVTKARSIADPDKYREYKAKELPCVNYNALFREYKVDKNIIKPSGLLYLDFDNPLFSVDKLDLSKVFAYYKSLSGYKYSVLVKVEGLSKVNYKDTVTSICKELGVLEFIDTDSLRIGQSNVISHDPDLFLNTNSITFNSFKTAPLSVSNKTNKGYSHRRGGVLRFNNLSDYAKDGFDYVVDFEKGFELIKCHIPFDTSRCSRNDILLSYCNNLVWLNQTITEDECLKILEAVNERAFTKPVEEARLFKIMGSVFAYLELGTLGPLVFHKNRKICFDKNSTLTREEKLSVCRNEYAKFRTDKSREKLRSIIESWDVISSGKISSRKIQALKLMSKKTVDKYYKEFKDLIAHVNSI